MTPGPSEDPTKKRRVTDFVFGKVIGEGSFSTVFLAKDVNTNKEFAIKVLEKQHIKKEKKIQYVIREKECLLRLGGGYFVKLYCTFQDNDRLYFCMSYAKHGEILKYISEGVLTFDCARYYAAEMVLALEILHEKGIIHRDFKPENILIDEHWHLLITDFGSAKIISSNDDDDETTTDTNKNEERSDVSTRRRNSFVGTAQYVSPEMLTSCTACFASDLWALGCVLFQMVAGSFPFKARSDYLIFQKILNLEYEFTAGFDERAKDLVERLLVIEPEKRLGAQDEKPYVSVRAHCFFAGLDWGNLGTPPKINRSLEDIEDCSELLDNLEPGLDEEKVSRLHLELVCPTNSLNSKSSANSISKSSNNPISNNPISNSTNSTSNNPISNSTNSISNSTNSISNSTNSSFNSIPNSISESISTTPMRRRKSQLTLRHIFDLRPEEINDRLAAQRLSDPYHPFVENNLILKSGFIDKRKGLFARKRMFILTLGPHLYYVDPAAMVLKGEVPWSDGVIRTEAKSFKMFLVHTPNRIYYLEDQNGYALEWCKCIEEVKSYYFPPEASS